MGLTAEAKVYSANLGDSSCSPLGRASFPVPVVLSSDPPCLVGTSAPADSKRGLPDIRRKRELGAEFCFYVCLDQEKARQGVTFIHVSGEYDV